MMSEAPAPDCRKDWRKHMRMQSRGGKRASIALRSTGNGFQPTCRDARDERRPPFDASIGVGARDTSRCRPLCGE